MAMNFGSQDESARLRSLLAETINQRDATEEKLTAIVIDCRATGMPWADIGQALGMSKQAAWERYKGATAEVDKKQQERIQAMLDFVEEALGPEITPEELDEITRLGREEPLPEERARPFYRRILKILHPDYDDARLDAEVDEVMRKREARDHD